MITLKNTGLVMLIFGLLFFGQTVRAQEKAEAEELSKFEVFGGYSLLRADGANLHGWKTGVGYNFNRWLAVAADADGHYFSETTPGGTEKRREYSAAVGPHFSYRNKSKFVPFVYAMPGVVWETHSHSGESETHTGFAFETGGGVDLELSKTVAIRLVDITASITHVHGHTSTKPKFSTGIVFHFGRK